MIFKRCNWCRYCFKLRRVGELGEYIDSRCCIYPLKKGILDSYIYEVNANSSCDNFKERIKKAEDKGGKIEKQA